MSPRPVAPTSPRRPIRHVVVVVLTYDSPPGVLERSVRAARACDVPDGVGLGLVVVDNGGSAPGRLAADDVDIVAPGVNGGYAAGMNAGIRRAFDHGADAVALLNDDVTVEPGWMVPLLAELAADPAVGAAQPTLLFGSGPVADVDGPGRAVGADVGEPVVNSAGVVIDRYGAASDRLRGASLRNVPDGSVDVAAFTGGAVVVRRDLFDDVGLFDERFFLYYEDVELARRARRRGWRLRHVSSSRVWHLGSATTVMLGDDVRRLQERNRLWSSAMHGSAPELMHGIGLSLRRLRHAPRAAHRAALVQGIAGIPGRLVARALRRRR